MPRVAIVLSVVCAAVLVGVLTLAPHAQEADTKRTPEQQVADLTAQLKAEKEAHERDVTLIRFQLNQCQLQTSYADLQRLGCSVTPGGQVTCTPKPALPQPKPAK